jgi:diguanylate cyclase (GGDEF)-like protein
MNALYLPAIGSIAQRTLVRGDFGMTVRAAAELMHAQGVNSLLIEEDAQHFIFFIDELLAFMHEGGTVHALLRDAPVRKIACLEESIKVNHALDLLEQSGQRYLGVLNQQARLIGLISSNDILHSIDPAVLLERRVVGDIFARKMPVMFTADWILEDVLHHLRKWDDSIVVVEAGRAIGLISPQQVFGVMTQEKSAQHPLSHYMVSPVVTTPLSSSLQQALVQMRENKMHHVIVVDEQQRVVGLVTQSELIGYAYGSWINIMQNQAAELQALVASLEQRARGFEQLTLMDDLTGLGNRRLFHQQLQAEIERMRRYRAGPFSLVIFDVDHFKKVNDVHGHLAGDAALRALGGELNSFTRSSDTACRWGGEEFAVLLSSTTLEAAGVFATRFKILIENLEFPQGLKITISAGVGEYGLGEAENPFFERVDQALYRAKTKERNRVELDEVK